MENHFEIELDELRQKLLEMAGHAETAVKESVAALVERNEELAVRVQADDDALDRFEVEIDDMVILLFTKAPLAGDLRFVRMAMKVSPHLERIGDEATKIAKSARALSQEPPVMIDWDFPRMTTLSLAMVRDVLDSFNQPDSTGARSLIPRDKEVDALNKALLETIIVHMKNHTDTIQRCLHWIVAAKSLERIADHAKNIAEELVYFYEAQDIRHKLTHG